jgi:hypothetical protein
MLPVVGPDSRSPHDSRTGEPAKVATVKAIYKKTR